MMGIKRRRIDIGLKCSVFFFAQSEKVLFFALIVECKLYGAILNFLVILKRIKRRLINIGKILKFNFKKMYEKASFLAHMH
jgi:hypothetical protein